MAFALTKLVYRIRGYGAPAKAVLVRMADVARDDGTDVRITVQRLADELELSARAVQQAIARLRQAGVLILTAEADPGAKLPRVYRLNVDLMASLSDAAEISRRASRVHEVHPSTPPFEDTGAGDSPVEPDAPVGTQEIHPCTGEQGATDAHPAPLRVQEMHPQPLYPEKDAAADARATVGGSVSPPGSQLDRLLDLVGVDVSTNAGWWFAQNALGKWLASGADFELDVVPAVRAVMTRRGGSPPQTPDYFNQPVLEAMRKRLAPLPAPLPHEERHGRYPPRPDPATVTAQRRSELADIVADLEARDRQRPDDCEER